MVQVPKEKLACLEPLFAGWEETLVWSVVQGCMGKAWADSLERPRAALLWVGDFLFLGGDAEAPVARALAGFLPRELANGVALAVPQNESWLRLLEEAHGKRGKPITRYAIRKEPGVFDPGKLRANLEKLPQGMDTLIGSEGTYLSGGEQQRIALARAILKDAPIVVLDEATAFADPENEALIQKAFSELTRGRTVIMIAHRLSTVVGADKILVLEEGRIVEQGSHQELTAAGGLYARMWADYNQAVQWKITSEGEAK